MVNLQMPVHGHHHLVAVVALLLLHLLALVPVGDVQVEVEHVVCSVVTKLAVLVLDLQMDGVDVLVHSHLVGEHLRAVRTRHVGLRFKTGPTFRPHQVSFQLLENFSTAVARLLVEVCVHLPVVDVYICFSSTCERTGRACSQLSSVAVLHVDAKHLNLGWTEGTLFLWLLVVQSLVNS